MPCGAIEAPRPPPDLAVHAARPGLRAPPAVAVPSIAAITMDPEQQPQEPAEQLNSSAPVSGRTPRPCCLPGCLACAGACRTPDPRRSCHDLLTRRRSRRAGAATAAAGTAAAAARAAAAATAGCSRGAHCSRAAQPEPRRICGRPAQCGEGVGAWGGEQTGLGASLPGAVLAF